MGVLKTANAGLRRVLGPDHPNTLATMGNLAAVAQASGRPNDAVSRYEEALRESEAKLGHDHIGTLTALNNLASAYWMAGRMDDALPLLDRARDADSRTNSAPTIRKRSRS